MEMDAAQQEQPGDDAAQQEQPGDDAAQHHSAQSSERRIMDFCITCNDGVKRHCIHYVCIMMGSKQYEKNQSKRVCFRKIEGNYYNVVMTWPVREMYYPCKSSFHMIDICK